MVSVLTLLAALIFGIDQAAPKGQLVIVVLEAGTEQPIQGADVWIVSQRSNTERREATTGPDGRVRITDLPADQYEIGISSASHLSWNIKLRNSGFALPPFHRPLQAGSLVYQPGRALVRVDKEPETVTFRLPRGAIIAGHVRDERGRPVRGALVQLFEAGDYKVDRHFVVARVDNKVTGADGTFEFIGLSPGAYRVAVNPDEEPFDYNDIYYPGTTEVESSEAITVDAAGRRDVIVPLRRVRTVTLRGRVLGHDVRDGELKFRRLDVSTGHSISSFLIDVGRDGTFDIEQVESGVFGLSYARGADGQEPTHVAFAVIHVNASPVSEVELKVLPVASMSGRIVVQGTGLSNSLDLHVLAEPTGIDTDLRMMLSRSNTTPDGQSFRIDTLLGPYRFVIRTPSGVLPTAMLLEDGTDILGKEFTAKPGMHYGNVRVILTEGVATIRGTVPMAGRENVYGGLRVVAFPRDDETWHDRRGAVYGHVSDDGTFTLSDVVPWREYYVATCQIPCEAKRDGSGLRELVKTATLISVGRPGEYRVTLKR